MKILALTPWTFNCNIWWSSLKAIGHQIYIEQYDKIPYYLHSQLIELTKVYNPDYVLFVGADERTHGQPVPSLDILSRINDIVPTILIFCDGRDERQWELLNKYDNKQCFTLMVNLDGSFDSPIAEFKNGLVILCPTDHTMFSPKDWGERTIRFGMVGSFRNRPIRGTVVKQACKLGLIHYPYDYARSNHLLYKIMCDTKITLNTAVCMDGTPHPANHVKARVIEAGFAGCCLFETKDSPTNKWFIPGVDYLEYETQDDLVNLLEIDDSVLEEIAIRFHKRVVKEHHPVAVWQRVFDTAGAVSSTAANAA